MTEQTKIEPLSATEYDRFGECRWTCDCMDNNDLISRKSLLDKIEEWSSKLDCENGLQRVLAEFEYMIANEPSACDIHRVAKT